MAWRMAAMAALAATLAAGVARADPREEPVEGWRYPAAFAGGAALQLVAGTLSALPLLSVVYGGFGEGPSTQAPYYANLALSLALLTLATPAVSSLMVWYITDRRGSYLVTWLGGVLGAGLAMPLLLAHDNAQSFALGQLILPPLLETIAAGQSAPAVPAWNPPASSPVLGLERVPRATVVLAAPLFRVTLP